MGAVMGIELHRKVSKLQGLSAVRAQYQPRVPPALKCGSVKVSVGDASATAELSDRLAVSEAYPHTYGLPLVQLMSSGGPNATTAKHLPLRIGVAFCGRQSPGGHNVITGLFDALKSQNANSILIGFIGGTEGIFSQRTVELTNDMLKDFRNQGGYDLLGRTKDQIKSYQQIKDAKAACEALKLDVLVLIGGCGTNSDAAQLAEFFLESGCTTKVVGIPVTIDGDLKNQFVETNVGFDTTCKVYSQLISNICTDALSAEKYYYFIRLMGRQASHVSLECTLQSQSNMVLLGEEVANSKMTLFDVTMQICDAIQARGEQGKNYGVVLLPEGLIERIPEFRALLQEINTLRKQDEDIGVDNISSRLTLWAAALYDFLPIFIKKQLLLDRESDGSVQLSQIETEKLLAQLVDTEMIRRTKTGLYEGKKFNAICHFFGYQARGSLPSNFDCNYAYTLGQTAYYVAQAGLTGYMATVANLKQDVSEWRCGGAPLTAMMSVKRWLRGPGVSQTGKPAVHTTEVDLKGKPYGLLTQHASSWLMDDLYRNPGPIQYAGPGADLTTITLSIEDNDYIGEIQEFYAYLDKVKEIVKPGCAGEVLKAALSSMASVTDILTAMSAPSYRSLTPF